MPRGVETYDLRIKQFRNGQTAAADYFPRPEHIPEAIAAKGRERILPGEVFTVENRKIAREYLASGLLEVVL